MNIVILALLLNIINIVSVQAISRTHNRFNHNYGFERFALRCIIFKEKKMAKIMKTIKNKLEIYSNKSIVSIAEGITSYNELSEDDKTIIETIISSCY